MYAFRMVGSPKCLRDSGALEVVRESIPKIAAISFFADLEHKCPHSRDFVKTFGVLFRDVSVR